MKKESSKWIKEQGDAFAGFHWQDGYAGFSVSESAVERCIEYIDHQKSHHARMTFKEELLMLLKKHHVPYDEVRVRLKVQTLSGLIMNGAVTLGGAGLAVPTGALPTAIRCIAFSDGKGGDQGVAASSS